MSKVFREDGVYNIDFKELEKIKKSNLTNGRIKFFGLTEEQEIFYKEYWYFLTPTQRKIIIEKIFPGKSYDSVVKRAENLRNSGMKFKRPEDIKEKFKKVDI